MRRGGSICGIMFKKQLQRSAAMKTLIVYFSLEGNTKWTVERLAAKLSADTLALVPKSAYPDKGFKKFLWGGKSALMKETPELEPYTADLSQYGRVIFATPIWAGTFAPPLRTFIQSEDLSGKEFALAACSGGGSPEKAFAALRALLNISGDIPTLGLVDPKSNPSAANDAALAAFCEKLAE